MIHFSLYGEEENEITACSAVKNDEGDTSCCMANVDMFILDP